MAEAKQGDTVRVHYTGRLDNGMVFDSSREREPLEFTIGSGQIIAGFEKVVVGMNPGETVTTTIEADHAYGPYREDMVLSVQRNQLPQDLEPQIGQRLESPQQDGPPVVFTVTQVSEEGVTLDANHPLAGKDLTFDIELMEIA